MAAEALTERLARILFVADVYGRAAAPWRPASAPEPVPVLGGLVRSTLGADVLLALCRRQCEHGCGEVCQGWWRDEQCGFEPH